MNNQMTTAEFNTLLRMAVDEHHLDPDSAYVEFTWWDHVYRPLIETDCNRAESEFIMVFGDDLCNICCNDKYGNPIPAAFWIYKDAGYIEQVIHRPIKVKCLLDSKFMLEFDKAKFLFCNSPINYYVDINPFKTTVYKNSATKDTILALYAENRDSGEWRPFSGMNQNQIKLVEF